MAGLTEGQPQFKVYGRVGDPEFLHGLSTDADGYLVQITPIQITEAEKRFGRKAAKAFDDPTSGLNRVQPWSIVNGVFEFPAAAVQTEIKKEAASTDQPFDKLVSVHTIPAHLLRGEVLPPSSVKALKMTYGIETWLSDFTEAARVLFRNTQGVSDFYDKWSMEESMHGRAIRTILIETGNGDPEDMDDFRDQVLSRKWVPPFNTRRRMLFYANPQEILTGETYIELGNDIKVNGNAPLSRKILTAGVGSDEFYHGHAFDVLIGIEAEEDPKGTEEDGYFVLEHLLMPGDLIMPSTRENASAFNHIGVDKRFIGRSLYRAMKKLNEHLEQRLGGRLLDLSRVRDIVSYRVGIAASDNEAWGKLLAGTR